MELIVLWIVLGVIVGLIAHAKGRNFWAWFIYGAALFIVAIVHVLMVAPDRATLDRRVLRDGGKRCPHCAELIRGGAQVCRFCGRDVGEAGGPAADAPRVIETY